MQRANWQEARALRVVPFLLWLSACTATLIPPLFAEGVMVAVGCLVSMIARAKQDEPSFAADATTYLHRRWFRRRLAKPGRVVVSLAEARHGTFATIVMGFAAWVIAMVVAAACSHMPPTFSLVAVALTLALLAIAFWRFVFGMTTTEVATLGCDGVTLGKDFVPHARVESMLSRRGERVIVRARDDAGRPKFFDVTCEDAAQDLCAAMTRRHAAWSAKAAAGSSETRNDADAEVLGLRVAAVPRAELVRTLNDGSAPREERIRVASVLSTHAPEAVAQLADETADDELREALVRRA